MYRKAAFDETDPSALEGLLERDSFITLITVFGDVSIVSRDLAALMREHGD